MFCWIAVPRWVCWSSTLCPHRTMHLSPSKRTICRRRHDGAGGDGTEHPASDQPPAKNRRRVPSDGKRNHVPQGHREQRQIQFWTASACAGHGDPVHCSAGGGQHGGQEHLPIRTQGTVGGRLPQTDKGGAGNWAKRAQPDF